MIEPNEVCLKSTGLETKHNKTKDARSGICCQTAFFMTPFGVVVLEPLQRIFCLDFQNRTPQSIQNNLQVHHVKQIYGDTWPVQVGDLRKKILTGPRVGENPGRSVTSNLPLIRTSSALVVPGLRPTKISLQLVHLI